MPQIGGMFSGDFTARRRWPNSASACRPAIDNRPLQLRGMGSHAAADRARLGDTGTWEMERTGGVFAEQVVRPTGLIDPR